MASLFKSTKKEEDKTDAAAEGGSKEEKKEEDSKGTTDAPKGEVRQMKRGDYMIHVFIEQGKNFKVDESDTIDPLVEMNCLGQRKYTTAKEKVNNTGIAVWNEHIFYEPKNLDTATLEKGKIEIKLLDKGFFKDTVLGYYEFDFSYIYLMDNHALMHKWVIMSNPEAENFGEVTGYLKLSITIAASGDEQVSITDDPNPNEDDVIQPPQIKPEYYQLKMRFFKAEKIVPMDRNLGGVPDIDAYVRLDYKTVKLKSKVLSQPENGSISWNQEFLIPAQIPIMGGRLVFRIFDKDSVTDEVVGAINLEARDIIDGLYPSFFWKNIYGAPLGVSGKSSRMMNENPELGSLWKGRILMQVVAEKCDKPVRKVQDIPEEDVLKSKEYEVYKTFQLMLYVHSVFCLPKENESYNLEIRIAEHSMLVEDPMVDGDYNRFRYRTDNNITFTGPYQNVDDIGSVFIYLTKKFSFGGVKRIAYYRGDISEFQKPDPMKLKWVELLPDLAIGECKQFHKAGILGFKMSLNNMSDDGDAQYKTQYKNAWGKRINKRPGNLKVRAYVFQCRDLPAADSDGSSDPYLRLAQSGNPLRTKTIQDNCNPLFYEALDLIFEADNNDELPPFIIDAYDEDEASLGKNTSDYLSRAMIEFTDIGDAYSESDAIPVPKWFPLRFKQAGPMSGEVLVSFSVVEDDFNFKYPLNYVPLEKMVDRKEFKVSMNVLGLRGLESPGILPVKKAFISFNLKSLVPPSIGTNLLNIKTEPKNPGPDPTINTLMEFSVPLPVEKLYCPRLSCQVFDCIFTGFSQPLIGNFIIPIGQLLHDLIQERFVEMKALKKVVKELKEIEEGRARASIVINSTLAIEEIANLAISDNAKDLQKEQGKAKNKIAAQLAKAAANDSFHSLNRDDDQPLLEGDHDEELRQSDRIVQKERNAKEGKAPRTDALDKLLQQQEVDEETGFVEKEVKISKKLTLQLIAQEVENQEKAQRDVDDERSRQLGAFESAAGNASKASANLIMPTYEHDQILSIDRESNPPPVSAFFPLGWDEDSQTKRKHYRKFYPDELENVKEVLPFPSPFQSYDIKRGQSRGAKKGFWAAMTNSVKTDESGEVSNEQSMGRFKAVIEVEAKEDRKAYVQEKGELVRQMMKNLDSLAKFRNILNFKLDMNKLDTLEGRKEMELSMESLGVRHLNITKILADLESDEILRRQLLVQNRRIVRVYMINAYDLASRDIGGFSDPYLKVRIGNKSFNERDNYVLDEPNPEFRKHYDFEAVFPGCPPLVIDAMDYDDLFGDDLIGTTIVDLEDRFFLAEWRALKNKPVEFRQIYHPSSAVSQGVIRMWVEINAARAEEENKVPIWDICQKPPEEFEIRVCVFETKEIKMMDFEGTSDVFFRGFFDSKEDEVETDTHFRCQDGKASFNYRLLYKKSVPMKDYRYTIQAYDRDFFKSNDIIGASVIDFKQAFEDCALTKRPLCVNKKYCEDYMKKETKTFQWNDEETFWAPLISKNDEGVKENNGFVRMQIDIIPIGHAEKNKVGSGRSEPNQSPFLPPPVGRISFSINPCKMYKQLVGPALRKTICRYLCGGLCIVVCLALCFFVAPTVIGGLITNMITGA